jgi:hypothetical protein
MMAAMAVTAEMEVVTAEMEVVTAEMEVVTAEMEVAMDTTRDILVVLEAATVP